MSRCQCAARSRRHRCQAACHCRPAAKLPPPLPLYHRRHPIANDAALPLRCQAGHRRHAAVATNATMLLLLPHYCRCHAIATATISPLPCCRDAAATMPPRSPRCRRRRYHAVATTATAALPPLLQPCFRLCCRCAANKLQPLLPLLRMCRLHYARPPLINRQSHLSVGCTRLLTILASGGRQFFNTW